VKFYTFIFQKSKAGKIARYPKGIEKTTGQPAGSYRPLIPA